MMTNIPKPKAIIFDCWHTLFYVPSRREPFTPMARIANRLPMTYPLMKRIERSLQTAPEPNEASAAEKLQRDLKIPVTGMMTRRLARIIAASNLSHRPYHDTFKVLEEFKKDYKLGMLSNTSEISFAKLRLDFKLDDYFDVIQPSYETGILKPDPAAFETILKKLGVRAGEALMVGDSYRDDIQGAASVGIKGILIDRHNLYPKAKLRVHELSELVALLS